MEITNIETSQHDHHEDDHFRVLYEASYRGCVSTLNSLIRQDPLILNKINSQTAFVETPLHISASLGHFEFTKALLSHKPRLALELDAFRSTALHVASAEGHVDIVKVLVSANDEACVARDEEKRIPLHCGVIRGRLEVARELVTAKPMSLRILHEGKTVFHLCVEYNHLEILKALVELLDIINTSDLLDFQDLDGGNTILHLAVKFKRVETVRYLLSISKIREASNMRNKMGFRASDIVVRIPKDLKSLEIQVVFINSGIKFEKREMVFIEEVPAEGKRWEKIWKTIKGWLEYKGDYLEEMRGNLSLVSTVIATMTFQAALNPPGSYVQQGISNNDNNMTAPQYGITDLIDDPSEIEYRSRRLYNFTNRLDDDGRPLSCFLFLDDGDDIQSACPGKALLASLYPDDFLKFVIFNTISFMSSLAVTLLLVSGVPLKHTSVMLMLSLGMCAALYSLAMAYIYGFLMMAPDSIWKKSNHIFVQASTSLVELLGLVGAYIAVKFVAWGVRKCHEIKCRMSLSRRNRGFLSQ